tara:strand:- start:3270 stop:4073 length:804 start_codon:yes stop_codon:yes gene_type:complete
MAIIKPVNSVFEEIDGQLISPLNDGTSNPFVPAVNPTDPNADFEKELARLAQENQDKINADNAAALEALKLSDKAFADEQKNLADIAAKKLADEQAAALLKIKTDDAAALAEQIRLDAITKAQTDALNLADAAAALKAKKEIEGMLAAEQARMAQDTAAYASQQEAARQEIARSEAEAQKMKDSIAQQLAESKRASDAMIEKSKSEMNDMQRTSAAKLVGRRRAGKSAGDRSMLAGYAATGGPPTLGGGSSLGSKGGSLGTSGTLGV